MEGQSVYLKGYKSSVFNLKYLNHKEKVGLGFIILKTKL